MKYLTQKELRGMMLSSHRRVQEEKEEINKINVFPVPDQDTGNNIAKTIDGIKEAIEGKEFDSLPALSDAILDGALTNAQGNAGVIYTGFLAGLLSDIKEDKIGLEALATSFEKGSERARESIQDPKEGTILDVIEAAASTLREKAEKNEDIVEALKEATKRASDALLATQEKMEIFKKANVVDAGGMGFLIILESFLKSLQENGEEEKKEIEETEASQKIKRFIQILSNRYEVVSLVENPDLTQKEIRDRLRGLGNCLDIVKIKDKTKIHIHTDFPEEVKEKMRKMGKLQSLRVEDMTQEVVGEESVETVSVGLISDSQALLLSKIQERYQIGKVDFHYENGESTFEEIYEKGGSFPELISPTEEDYLRAFEEKLENFQKVLCITASSHLYDSFNRAMNAKQKLSDPKSVFVFDSESFSAGQSLVVLKAIELIQEQRNMKEIIRHLRKAIPKIHCYIAIENTDWLTKGKRLSQKQIKWVQRINKVLKFKPLLKIKKGKIRRAGPVFSDNVRKTLLKKIVDASKKQRKGGAKIRAIIGYTNNKEEAVKLRKELKGKAEAEISFTGVTPPSCRAIAPGNLIAAWTTI